MKRRQMHDSILAQIKSLGYATSVHRMGDYIEMHAVELAHPENQHIARVVGSDGPDECDRCAAMLAQMVGIDLEDG
jgi:hypothetical protein